MINFIPPALSNPSQFINRYIKSTINLFMYSTYTNYKHHIS